MVFINSEGPHVRVCTEELVVFTGQELSAQGDAVLLPLLIQLVLLPRNVISSLSWKKQLKEGSVCAYVEVIVTHLNAEIFVFIW